jgi:hypothetical protein
LTTVHAQRHRADHRVRLTPLANQRERLTPLADQRVRLTPLANQRERLTPLADQRERLTPLANQRERLTPLADQRVRLTPLADQRVRLTPLGWIWCATYEAVGGGSRGWSATKGAADGSPCKPAGRRWRKANRERPGGQAGNRPLERS